MGCKKARSTPGALGSRSVSRVCAVAAAQTPFKISPWQAERVQIVMRALTSLVFHVERKRGVWPSAKMVARRYHRRILKADPSRIVNLSPGTLVHFYYRWKHSGGAVSALLLNYTPGKRGVHNSTVLRFIRFASSRYWPSLHAAHAAFCQRPESQQDGQPVRYDPLRRNLPKGFFEALNSQRKIVAQAETQIGLLRERFEREVRARVSTKTRGPSR